MLPGFVCDESQRRARRRWIGDVIAGLVADGKTWREAAAEVGLTLRRTYQLGTLARPDLLGRRGRVPQAVREAIKEAVTERDATYREIAACFGVSPDTVCRIACELRGGTIRGGVPHRCPTCGAMIVTRECLACKVRGE